jgi:biotin operon repressor
MKAKGFYVNTPKSLILDTKITGNDFRVLHYLALCQAGDEICFPGIRRIARKLGIDRTTVQLCINRLRHTDYLSVRRKGCSRGYQNIYKVNLNSVRKIRTLVCGKSGRTHYTVKETDPILEKSDGLKAGANRETPREKVIRKSTQERISRREQLKQAKDQAKQPKTTNQPDKEVNHGTE